MSKAETSSSLEESVLEVIDLMVVPEVNPKPLISDNETAFVEDVISEIIVDEEVLTEGQQKYSEEELNKFKVVELRSIAYREDKIDLSKKEIKFANKQLLIQALLKLKS